MPKTASSAGTRSDRQRVDKWLWHARMVRTRNAASGLAEAGYIRCNGQRITAASYPVRAGDVITLALDRAVRIVKVVGFAQRRGAAPAARNLYLDLTAKGDHSSRLSADKD